jgi:hypothetical protein
MLMRLFHGYSFEHVDKGASKKQFNARRNYSRQLLPGDTGVICYVCAMEGIYDFLTE